LQHAKGPTNALAVVAVRRLVDDGNVHTVGSNRVHTAEESIARVVIRHHLVVSTVRVVNLVAAEVDVVGVPKLASRNAPNYLSNNSKLQSKAVFQVWRTAAQKARDDVDAA
jgi:hypothetical protein